MREALQGSALLLDNDLRRLGRKFLLDPAIREALAQQLRADTELLARCEVFDYSLVVGVRSVDEDCSLVAERAFLSGDEKEVRTCNIYTVILDL